MSFTHRGFDYYSGVVSVSNPVLFERYVRGEREREMLRWREHLEDSLSPAAGRTLKYTFLSHSRFTEVNGFSLKRHSFFDLTRKEVMKSVSDIVSNITAVDNCDIVKRVIFSVKGSINQEVIKYLVFFIQKLGQKRVHLFFEDPLIDESLFRNMIISNHLGIDVIIESSQAPLQTEVLLFYLYEGKASIFPSEILFRIFLARVFNASSIITMDHPCALSLFLLSCFPDLVPNCFMLLLKEVNFSELVGLICNYLKHVTGKDEFLPERLSEVYAVDTAMVAGAVDFYPVDTENTYREKSFNTVVKNDEFLFGNHIIRLTVENLKRLQVKPELLRKFRTLMFFAYDVVFAVEDINNLSAEDMEFLSVAFKGYPFSLLLDTKGTCMQKERMERLFHLCSGFKIPVILVEESKERYKFFLERWLNENNAAIEVQPFSKACQRVGFNLVGLDLNCPMMDDLYRRAGISSEAVDFIMERVKEKLGSNFPLTE